MLATSEAGDLHIDLTILNETGEWSAMQAVPAKPAVLKAGDGTDHQLRHRLCRHGRTLPGSGLSDERLHRPGRRLKPKRSLSMWNARAQKPFRDRNFPLM